ncbi:ribose-phosphate diphosphokinase [Sandaracinobacteroides sp. A072]|uniref:ribose-phosphate diphosphokinase n=1 Tax=Sandaracinobacteroides sp. A072 TaxID=3461146 RepID=UPI004041F21A
MKSLLLPMPGNEPLADALAALDAGEAGRVCWRRFPDGEGLLRIEADVGGRAVDIICTLADPDPKLVPLLFAAMTARELGATRVRLVAPYLAYMRQDIRFQPGEAVSARLFARILSDHFDALVTIDPHLHRIHCLSEVYGIPATVLGAAPLLGAWVAAHVPDAILIGPDSESAQWVSAVAAHAGVPHAVLEKTRHGDHAVDIALEGLPPMAGRTPVLVDDIISSGGTMLTLAAGLERLGHGKPACLAVHALFPEAVADRLRAATCHLVATDSVPHPCARMSVAPLIAAHLKQEAQT